MEITMRDQIIQDCQSDMAKAVAENNRFQYEMASRRWDDVLDCDDPDLDLTVEEWHDKRVADELGIPVEEWVSQRERETAWYAQQGYGPAVAELARR